MAAQVRSLPRFAVGLVALVVLQAGCSPKVTAPPEPPYSVRRGDEAFRFQDYKGAITSYHSYLDESQKDAYTARVFYKTALAEYRLGHYQDTLVTLDQLQQRYPKGRWVQVDALRGDAERELDRPMAALKAWDEAWDISNDADHHKLRQRIVSLARGLNERQLVQARRVVENDDVRVLLEQQVALQRPPGIEEPFPEGEGLSPDEGVATEPTSKVTSRAVPSKGRLAQPTPAVAAAYAAPPPSARLAPPPSRIEAPAQEAMAPESLAPEPAAPAPPPERRGGAPVRPMLSPPMAEARVPETLAEEPPAPALQPERSGGASARPMLSPPVAETAPLAAAERQQLRSEPQVPEPLPPEPLAPEPPVPSLHPTRDGGAPVRAMLSPPIGVAPPVAAAERKVQGQPKVACLLPLSGPSRELGTRALRGVRLVFGEDSDRLVIADAGGDAASALQRFGELLRNPDVVAVIGPLRSDDAEAVAPLARQAQMPLLLLSQRDGLAGGSVLQVGVTGARLVTSVLQYAMDKVHMRRFGILYPEDDTGKQYVAAFRSEAERRGGTIVGVDAYSPRAPELPAVTLKRWRNGQDVQAIFLPDNVSAAQSVVRFLQRDMPDITLLGVSGWEALANAGNDAATGVFFADGFYSGSTRPGTQQFVARFQEAYGDRPGAVEAQAYDAGLLAQSALDAGARARIEVLPALQSSGAIEGATGMLTVTRTGLDSRLFLLQVYDGKVEEVSGGTS